MFMPQDIFVKRSDPVYMAHAYLTKVPLAAIEPFIKDFSKPGDIVVDPFAGSGMTGIAAALHGRRARLFDISVLGQHIGRNYVNLVDPLGLASSAQQTVEAVTTRLGGVYDVTCTRCGNEHAALSKTTWSAVVRCACCSASVNFYHALENAGWRKSGMKCPTCHSDITSKAARIGEEAVLATAVCPCSPTHIDQAPQPPTTPCNLEGLQWPDVTISVDRQMYQASALGKHGRTTVASFYSTRNLAVLAALKDAIDHVTDEALRSKLTFAFTAILTRASKRYQWSHKRPLNAANANYYVAPVFYEWNVFDLFLRKVNAAVRADAWLIARHTEATGATSFQPDVTYECSSAENIPLPDNSVDYIFTDPPFGSSLFYADMALFHEGWLGALTDHTLEAVIDRGTQKTRDGGRYEQMLTAALQECRRILRPGGYTTMVFGNSFGAVWALVQRAVRAAGLVIDPDSVVILNKGQRSAKGLASGFEHVATLDLILSMRERRADDPQTEHAPTVDEVEHAVTSILDNHHADSPSHLYLGLLRRGMAAGWDLSTLDLRLITKALTAKGWGVDPASGKLQQLVLTHA